MLQGFVHIIQIAFPTSKKERCQTKRKKQYRLSNARLQITWTFWNKTALQRESQIGIWYVGVPCPGLPALPCPTLLCWPRSLLLLFAPQKSLLVQLYVCYPRRQHSFLLKTSSIAPVKNGPRSARSTRYWHDNIYFFTCFGSSMQYSILWKFSRQIKICNYICQCNLNKTVKDDKWWLAETAQLWKYLSNYC